MCHRALVADVVADVVVQHLVAVSCQRPCCDPVAPASVSLFIIRLYMLWVGFREFRV